jgi:uncharacterized membrane protein
VSDMKEKLIFNVQVTVICVSIGAVAAPLLLALYLLIVTADDTGITSWPTLALFCIFSVFVGAAVGLLTGVIIASVGAFRARRTAKK